MATSPRIFNLTRGFHLKRSQALRAIEAGACEWVEFDVSIRNLTLAESIAKRNQQAAERDPLASAELPGLIYQPAERNSASTAKSRQITFAAGEFFKNATTQWVN